MAEVPRSSSSEGDRQRPATPKHGSSFKRLRFGSDLAPEEETAFSLPDDDKGSTSFDFTPSVWFEPDAINDNKVVLEVTENDHRFRCQDVLNHYRDTKGPDYDYELVELIKHMDFPILPRKHFHYNFKAKKRERDDDDDDDDGSPKLFYADVIEEDYGTYRLISVIQCDILDPSGPVGNCRGCTNGVLHPTDLVYCYEPSIWMHVGPLPYFNVPSLTETDLENAPGVALIHAKPPAPSVELLLPRAEFRQADMFAFWRISAPSHNCSEFGHVLLQDIGHTQISSHTISPPSEDA